MIKNKQKPQIVRQELALDGYLNTLLEEIPALEAVKTAATTVDAEKNSSSSVAKLTSLKTDTLQKNKTIARLPVALQPQEKTAILSKPLVPLKKLPLSVMPDWSQHEFQALFFKVDKMILATPLTALLRTIPVSRKPTKIPGQPLWFMGLLDEHDCRIGILDTAQMVFGKNRGSLRQMKNQIYKSILITADSKWGLACDEVLSIGKLEPEKVRWRTMREKRPWLIGTVIDELTAVIDLQQLVPHRRTG